jgi:hypothetical protein
MTKSLAQNLVVIAAVSVCGSNALALPPDQIVTFSFRETPSDPQSGVLIKARMHIEAKSQNGNKISWQINKLTFAEHGGGDWTEDSPGLGNWVVNHADPADPVARDFDSPPSMTGTATEDSGGDDLSYDFIPGTCDATEAQMYSGDVVCSEYSFVAGTTTIAEEDPDEPEEIDSENDPS